jgi:hypothetical protein
MTLRRRSAALRIRPCVRHLHVRPRLSYCRSRSSIIIFDTVLGYLLISFHGSIASPSSSESGAMVILSSPSSPGSSTSSKRISSATCGLSRKSSPSWRIDAASSSCTARLGYLHPLSCSEVSLTRPYRPLDLFWPPTMLLRSMAPTCPLVHHFGGPCSHLDRLLFRFVLRC